MKKSCSDINTLREKIEKIDKEIILKIEDRFAFVEKIREEKKQVQYSILDVLREEDIYDSLVTHSSLHASCIRAVWKEIFSYSKHIQNFICYITQDTICIRSLVKMFLGSSTKIEKYSNEKIFSNEHALFIKAENKHLELIKKEALFVCVEYTIFSDENKDAERYFVYTKKEIMKPMQYTMHI